MRTRIAVVGLAAGVVLALFRARRVVAPCGALHTPALLLRSGIANRNIGRGLHLHPVTAVGGVFDPHHDPIAVVGGQFQFVA